jgi:2-desacetyl-2-hydroxyethyl bacteriochlorophyllide A dehydrogenase
VKTLVCQNPGQLVLEERPDPERKPDMVLVKPRRVGICGTDYHIFEGNHPFLQYPRVMGHELAVQVIEAPRDSNLAVGAVYAVNPYISCGYCNACRLGKPNCCVKISVLGVHRDGGMAQFLSLPPQNLVLAESLTADECAAVEFLAIGAHAVRRGAVGPGDRALVVGAGPIGLGAVLFAKAAGAEVAVLDHDPERARMAALLAEGEAITIERDAVQAVREFTSDDGFDVVFDATGNQNAMERGFAFVAHGGRYVFISVIRDTITFSDPDFHRKEISLHGSRNATREDFERVIAAIRARQIPVDRLITHRTDLAGAAANIPIWAKQKRGLIKALIEIE